MKLRFRVGVKEDCRLLPLAGDGRASEYAHSADSALATHSRQRTQGTRFKTRKSCVCRLSERTQRACDHWKEKTTLRPVLDWRASQPMAGWSVNPIHALDHCTC